MDAFDHEDHEDHEDQDDPSPHEPRVTGSPERIWLVYGELDDDATHAEICRNGDDGVTWCEDQRYNSDVEYVRADTAADALRAMTEDRDSWEQQASDRTDDAVAFAKALEHERSKLHEARDALLSCAGQAEALKQDCGMDPESPQAIRNAQYQGISSTAHIALGTVRGPVSAAPDMQPAAWQVYFPYEQRREVVFDLDDLPGDTPNCVRDDAEPLYTADQMHDYARVAVEAERSRLRTVVAAEQERRKADVLDAARYRWLTAHARSAPEPWCGQWSLVIEGPAPKRDNCEDAIDEAIDAAMRLTA